MSDRYPLRTHIQVRGHYCYHTGRSDKTSYVCLYLCTQRKYRSFFSFIQIQSIRVKSELLIRPSIVHQGRRFYFPRLRLSAGWLASHSSKSCPIL